MTAPDVNADVRARFEAWLKRNGIEIFPNWREDDLAVVSVGKLMKIAHADLAGEVRELVEAAKQAIHAIEDGDSRQSDEFAAANRLEAALAKFHPTHQETK